MSAGSVPTPDGSAIVSDCHETESPSLLSTADRRESVAIAGSHASLARSMNGAWPSWSGARRIATSGDVETVPLMAPTASTITLSRSCASLASPAVVKTSCAPVAARPASVTTWSLRDSKRLVRTLVEMYAPMIVTAMAESTTVIATIRTRSDLLQMRRSRSSTALQSKRRTGPA
jgi:hypothetical protein